IHVAIDGTYAGSIGLADVLKPSARACIAALHSLDIETSLVTGDQPATAQHVASLVGIPASNVYAGILPSGKQTIIEDLQSQNTIVAMVGDGINDSPALATADVGISLASGTDVAMEAADIVLMKPTQLMDIPASLHLSRTIFRRIKLNLLLSCIYNAVGLPIAMGFLLPWGITLPPLAAGAAMACSSVTVVVSSLLLKFWRRPGWMVEEEAGLEVRSEWSNRFGSSSKNRGIWSRIGAVRDAWRGKRSRRVGEGERGAYVQLDSYEAV
ncbi:heavy metal translocatin, partial [Hortaea werneckii]